MVRTTKVEFVATGLGLGYKECCNCYRGRLRTARVLLLLPGRLRTSKVAFVLTLVDLGYTECCNATGLV